MRSALKQLLQRHDPKRPAPHITSALGAGLSLIAIAPCAIGVDVLRLDAHTLPDSEIDTLARDYLGPAAADALSKLQGQERLQHFAHAWAAHEAHLKCAGLPLTEWSADLARQLASFLTLPLDLPAPYLGALALRRGG